MKNAIDKQRAKATREGDKVGKRQRKRQRGGEGERKKGIGSARCVQFCHTHMPWATLKVPIAVFTLSFPAALLQLHHVLLSAF